MGNSRNLLPYPVFISRLTTRYQVLEFPRDEIYDVQEQDMYCLYGDWKGEQPKVHRGRLIPPPQAPPAPQEEQPPPSPPPQPAASEIPSSSERLQLNTQSMLRDAFPDMTFKHLLSVTSSEDESDLES
ncbi:hypothetical protein PIB30_088347 [Stylosanthes scabra]|uniref:Uncharacterized protein n=1 Tax=Stylosanthes scabra TaxID=79078 RepID=A0ABU6VS49_9FABA|nr:hypothetical protein [Stylosanthes scabra]